MNFLIYVATFVVLACVVLPMAVLAAFALLRDDQVWREPPGSDRGWREPPASRVTGPAKPG